MSETEKIKRTELDELLMLAKEDIDLDSTMGFASCDSLTAEQVAIEKLSERIKRMNNLLTKMVQRQNRDDRHAGFLGIANKFCNRGAMIVAAIVTTGLISIGTIWFQAQFEKSPLEKQQDELMLKMLEDKYGPIESPEQKK